MLQSRPSQLVQHIGGTTIDGESPGAGITKWEVDRLYESGVGETFHVLGMSISLQEGGQWAALGFMTGALVAMASVAAAMQEEVSMQGACLYYSEVYLIRSFTLTSIVKHAMIMLGRDWHHVLIVSLCHTPGHGKKGGGTAQAAE